MVAAITSQTFLKMCREHCQNTIRFPQGTSALQISNPYPRSLPVTKSIRAIHRTFLQRRVCFIEKVPRVCEALVELCGLLSVPLPELPQPATQFRHVPERAVGLIFIPSLQQMSQHGQ